MSAAEWFLAGLLMQALSHLTLAQGRRFTSLAYSVSSGACGVIAIAKLLAA